MNIIIIYYSLVQKLFIVEFSQNMYLRIHSALEAETRVFGELEKVSLFQVP